MTRSPAGESSGPHRPETRDVGEADAAAPVCVQLGQALGVHLSASTATGEEWVLVDAPSPLLYMESDPGTGSLVSFRIGVGPVRSWKFRAVALGRAPLTFASRQPLDLNGEPARTIVFDVSVF